MKLRVRTGRRKRREPLAVATGPEAVELACAWYDRESWQELRALASDPEALDESDEAWLASAEAALKRFEDEGTAVVKLSIDVADALAWAKEQGRPFNGAARAAYVALMARELSEG